MSAQSPNAGPADAGARPPRIYTIDPGLAFLDALAAGIRGQVGDEPLALSRVSVLLPTRRACRALGDAFLRQAAGKPLLLPRLRPLGDVDDDELMLLAEETTGAALDLPPAIPELRRRLMLSRAILGMGAGVGARGVEQAIELAGELARLLDQVETERLSFDGFKSLAPEEHAQHWRRTLDLLSLLTSRWPRVLAQEGAIGPADRRNRTLEALATEWRKRPPGDPIIAAGSTGSIPATADLLAVVARLPNGAVVLPGLDRELDDESWAVLDETHPQYGLSQLLLRLGVDRRQVGDWPADADRSRHAAKRPARSRLIAEAMRPAATTDRWRGGIAPSHDALEGLARIDCPHPQAEAATIALVMREALETPGRTAALVTPDRGLARRVAAELGRFDIAVDDSAGRPLADTPPGVFLRLVGEMASARMAPVALLACLKHPLAAGNRTPGEFRARARRLEINVLRGPRPASGFEGIIAALNALPKAKRAPELVAWVKELGAWAAPFDRLIARGGRPSEFLRAHVDLAERLTRSDTEAGAARLWAGNAGEAAAEFVAELARAATDFPPIEGQAYPGFFAACLGARAVRPRYGRHPRLAIMGLLEARLIQADVMILGGLNEGTWPPEPPSDPWLSRPMRKAFGLPAPERRIGLAAHDFAQGCAAPNVVITRSTRVEGTPTVASRWLLRLDTVLAAAGARQKLAPASDLVFWRQSLDRVKLLASASAPAPRPPVTARPNRLSVTEIETWRRDPYAIYARHVLGLKALDPLDADPGAAERGIFIHAALAEFVRRYPDALPAKADSRLIEIGRRQFGAALARPTVWAFWWPRFIAVARWFVANERTRRAHARPLIAEGEGELAIARPGGPFTLRARADRIDRLDDQTLAIIDYKTGSLPDKRDVLLGFAPQLALEAVIARGGGFAGVAAAPVSQLRYWRLSGGDPPGEELAIDRATLHGSEAFPDPVALADAALAGLERLIDRFRDPATPYRARPWPDYAPRYSDYVHLARVKEWSAAGDDE